MPISGKHHKKGPLMQDGSAKGPFSGVCRFLYILDITAFTRYPSGRRIYKKCTFYSYAQGCPILSYL